MTLGYKGLIIAGHRGYGCTDHSFYNFRDLKNIPIENTVKSVKLAFESGAAYIETDAVMSKDGVLFTLHNTIPQDHFFGEEKPSNKLNFLPFEEIQKHKTGPKQNGTVATLEEILETCHQYSPQTLSWDINIEIKGMQGSKQNYDDPAFLKNIAKTVKESNLPVSRVLFSSFALKNIVEMSKLLPGAQYGMLFCEDGENGEKKTNPAYTNHTKDLSYQYIPFDVEHTEHALDLWPDNTKLSYLHPEINSITEETIKFAADKGLGINCWALFEKMDDTRKEQYKQLARWCEKHDVFISVITDYCDEMIELAKILPKGPKI